MKIIEMWIFKKSFAFHCARWKPYFSNVRWVQTIIDIISPKKSLSGIFSCLMDVLWRLSEEDEINIYYRKNMSHTENLLVNSKVWSDYIYIYIPKSRL